MADKRKAAVAAERVNEHAQKKPRPTVRSSNGVDNAIDDVDEGVPQRLEPVRIAYDDDDSNTNDEEPPAPAIVAAAIAESEVDSRPERGSASMPPPNSFANIMRNRSSDAPRLSKAEKKRMRREWKRSQNRKARGLDPDADSDEDDDNGSGGPSSNSRRHGQQQKQQRRRKKRSKAAAGNGSDMQEPLASTQSPWRRNRLNKSWSLAVELVKARGMAVRALGQLLGTNWTGEQMQKVMIIYGHVFFMAMISNIYAAGEEVQAQSHLNDSISLPLSIGLLVIGIVSLKLPMHTFLAWQGIVFGCFRLIFALGFFPTSMLDADRRDMSVWSLVMCIDTLVAGAVSVARLGTPAAIVHGCTGFPIAFMLGRVCSCYVLGKVDSIGAQYGFGVTTHVVVVGYGLFSFITKNAAATPNRDPDQAAASTQVFRRSTRRRQESKLSAEGSGEESDAFSDMEPCYEVQETRRPQPNIFSDILSSVQAVLSNGPLLLVNVFLFASVARILFQKDVTDPNVFQKTCPAYTGMTHPGSVFQPDSLTVPLRFTSRSYLALICGPAIFLLVARHALSLVQCIQLALFGMVVAQKCYLDDPNKVFYLEASVCFAMILFNLVFELTTRLESRKRIGLAMVVQIFIGKGVALVLEKLGKVTFQVSDRMLFFAIFVSLGFSLTKLDPLVRKLRFSVAVLEDDF